MISLTATTAVMLYLSFTIAILFGLWTYQHYRKRDHKIIFSQQELYVCEFCHFAYLEDPVKPVTKCPQCHSFNKNNYYLS